MRDSGRLDADMLMDAAMAVGRGRGDAPGAGTLARLIQGARQFALLADPASDRRGDAGGCAIEVRTEGYRVVVRLRRGGDSITVSGPPRQAMGWVVDDVDATEAGALAMLADAARCWPSRGAGRP